MVLELEPQANQVVANPEELNPKVARQVSKIVEASESTSGESGPRTRGWAYSIPAAGVRYYSYVE